MALRCTGTRCLIPHEECLQPYVLSLEGDVGVAFAEAGGHKLSLSIRAFCRNANMLYLWIAKESFAYRKCFSAIIW